MNELSYMKILYNQFELKIPEYFREGRQSFLDDIDNKIENIRMSLNVQHNDEDPDKLQEEMQNDLTDGQQSVGSKLAELFSVKANKGINFDCMFSSLVKSNGMAR